MNEFVRGLLRYGRYITDETIDAGGHSARVRLIDCDGAIMSGRRSAPAGQKTEVLHNGKLEK